MKKHQPISGLITPRFAGIRTFARLPHFKDLKEVDIAIIGVPFDTAATYRSDTVQKSVSLNTSFFRKKDSFSDILLWTRKRLLTFHNF